MLTMFWFQFLRHLVSWIFHSIWWVGWFHRKPFADILKLFQSILRPLATREVYKWFTSWTLEVNHTHQGFLLFFWYCSRCMLCLSRRHVSVYLNADSRCERRYPYSEVHPKRFFGNKTNKETLNSDHPVLKCTIFYSKPRKHKNYEGL